MQGEPRVVFVQKFVPHYRLPFFETFRDRLAERNIAFVLLYGQPDPFEGSKVRTESPDWGIDTESRIFTAGGRHLYLQKVWKHVRRGDIVIVEHAAKLLDNYALYAASRLGVLDLAYFGHGENFLAGNELAVSRIAKQAMLRHVAHWFAYTETSRRSLIENRVPSEIITVVNNTLRPPPDRFEGVVKRPDKVVYIGGLYADKRIDLLIASCERVVSDGHSLRLEVIGEGPLRDEIARAAERYEWLTWRGALYGSERDRALAEATAILMPGAVGLVAIDSFHFGTPILTRRSTAHGPEIAYLEDEVNALFAPEHADADAFGRIVERILVDRELTTRLEAGCRASADRHTIDAMTDRFLDGIDRVIGERRA